MSAHDTNLNNREIHARARLLIAQHYVEGVGPKDRAWLDAHLEECSECGDVAHSTEAALGTLRTTSVPFPAGLASRTQFRVRLRAQQLQEREPRSIAIWAIAGVSWALGIATAPYIWQLFAWIGERLRVPKLVWELGFGLWWLIPALIAGAILLVENPRQRFTSWNRR
jgi:hypothetical protein